jgi:hypothetical protein
LIVPRDSHRKTKTDDQGQQGSEWR